MADRGPYIFKAVPIAAPTLVKGKDACSKWGAVLATINSDSDDRAVSKACGKGNKCLIGLDAAHSLWTGDDTPVGYRGWTNDIIGSGTLLAVDCQSGFYSGYGACAWTAVDGAGGDASHAVCQIANELPGIDGGGWSLVRALPEGSQNWHPAIDYIG